MQLYVGAKPGEFCCGVSEVFGITGYEASTFDAKAAITAIYENFKMIERPFYIFEDVNSSARVERLAKFIEEHNLGDTHTLAPALNPNSGNTITVMVWRVNRGILHSGNWGRQ